MVAVTRRAVVAAVFVVAVGGGVLPSAARADDTGSPVFADTFLALPTTQQEAERPYRAQAATIDGTRYARALVTGVGATPAAVNTASLVLRLNGRYDWFEATVGRDDEEAGQGPGYVYYEIIGDGKTLYRSDRALRSSRFLVKATPGNRTRKDAEDVRVSVRGVSHLQLVTRYALDLTQEAALVARARGCVWGDPRLTLAAVAATGSRTSVAGQSASDPLRAALRVAALRLAASAADLSGPKTSETPRLGVVPFRLDRGATVSDTFLRAVVTDLLCAARRGDSALLAVASARDQNRLSAALPPTGTAPSVRQIADAARRANMDIALTGALTETGGVWRLEMRFIDVRSQTTGNPVSVDLPTTVVKR